MQTLVQGTALSRAEEISSSQSTQTPYEPLSTRARASSIARKSFASVCFNWMLISSSFAAADRSAKSPCPSVVVEPARPLLCPRECSRSHFFVRRAFLCCVSSDFFIPNRSLGSSKPMILTRGFGTGKKARRLGGSVVNVASEASGVAHGDGGELQSSETLRPILFLGDALG